ncbi:amino acid transporter AVT6C-like [Magnolia sinica]|uniref:amino acid transporter AVT6C-like n=1 Tax=Magnolia sinica TaxID=86752 RepID=UPI0026590100|nr:amino acid transporter AVT6C-like [Magnolia sinica]
MKSGKAAGEFSPLLPAVQSPAAEDGGASVSGAVFNLSTSIIGAGIMSIPATLKVLGVGPAIVLIFAVAYMCDVSTDFLLRFTQSGGSTTYAGVMAESFGKLGSLALQICIMVTTMGCLIIYLIIIGDVLSGAQSEGTVHLGVLQEWFGVHWWNTRAFALLIVALFVMLPLLLLRRVDSLRFTSAISVLLAVVFMVVSSAMALYALFQGTTESPRWVPDLSGQVSFFDLFTAVPVIVTAFTFHFNVHPIRYELHKLSDMTTAVRISLILCAIIYAAVGFFGYLLFGDSTMADILTNFDRNSDSATGAVLNDIVRLSYALHLMLVYPLINFSLRINVDGLIFPKSLSLASDATRFLLITAFLIGFVYIVAIAFPNIWSLFQFVGSTSAVCIAFVFPGAIVLRDVHGISTRRDRIFAATMIIVAVIASAIAITTNIINLITPTT